MLWRLTRLGCRVIVNLTVFQCPFDRSYSVPTYVSLSYPIHKRYDDPRHVCILSKFHLPPYLLNTVENRRRCDKPPVSFGRLSGSVNRTNGNADDGREGADALGRPLCGHCWATRKCPRFWRGGNHPVGLRSHRCSPEQGNLLQRCNTLRNILPMYTCLRNASELT